MLNGSSIYHTASLPWAYPLNETTLLVVVRAKRGLVKSGKVVYGDRYHPPKADQSLQLKKAAYDGDFDYFQAELELRPPRFRYAFLLSDGLRSAWLGERGVGQRRPDDTSFFQYPYINRGDLLEVPKWLTEGVVYQIFPERFARGNPALDPPEVKDWADDKPKTTSFYGGDLEGIIQRLPPLVDLGVTVLYLTPIFTSPSNHKYDTADYYAIDPHFGDKETLRRLINRCHEAGIKVILDAVFNHSGSGFFAFQDVLEKGEKSAYADWFHIHSFPVRTTPKPNYETFSTGIGTMPKLRTENPRLRRYLLDVARYWLAEFEIDGWRIDVANEVSHSFWREFRAAIKEINPEAAIIGEIWHEARPWLAGDEFDGVTNYPLRQACLDFFAKGAIDAERFAEAIQRNLFIYPKPLLRASWNLLGSHDTERFMTACGGDSKKAALGAVFNLTWFSTPLIYYGDEIGMAGKDDPDCRRPMLWERESWDLSLYKLYRRLIGLRRKEAALRQGEASVLYADGADNTLIYLRQGPSHKEPAVIALNNSAAEKTISLAGVKQGELLKDLNWQALTGTGRLQAVDCLKLGPYAALIGLNSK